MFRCWILLTEFAEILDDVWSQDHITFLEIHTFSPVCAQIRVIEQTLAQLISSQIGNTESIGHVVLWIL